MSANASAVTRRTVREQKQEADAAKRALSHVKAELAKAGGGFLSNAEAASLREEIRRQKELRLAMERHIQTLQDRLRERDSEDDDSPFSCAALALKAQRMFGITESAENYPRVECDSWRHSTPDIRPLTDAQLTEIQNRAVSSARDKAWHVCVKDVPALLSELKMLRRWMKSAYSDHWLYRMASLYLGMMEK